MIISKFLYKSSSGSSVCWESWLVVPNPQMLHPPVYPPQDPKRQKAFKKAKKSHLGFSFLDPFPLPLLTDSVTVMTTRILVLL